MTATNWIILSFSVLALGFLIWLFIECFIPLYDRLVQLRETCYQIKADIDAKRKQRRELLPQIVAVVRTYSQFESGTVSSVAIQKVGAQRARTPTLPLKGDGLGFVIGWADARALGDNWPDLKANDQYSLLIATAELLTREITETWRLYNQAVQEYRALRSSFWGGIVAAISGCFPPLDYLDAPSERDQVIVVEMGDPLHSLVEKTLPKPPTELPSSQEQDPTL